MSFGHGAGDSLPNLDEGHHGIFNVQQRMPTDGTGVQFVLENVLYHFVENSSIVAFLAQ